MACRSLRETWQRQPLETSSPLSRGHSHQIFIAIESQLMMASAETEVRAQSLLLCSADYAISA